jgi:hypothetical protein
VPDAICDQNRKCKALPVKKESCEHYACAEGLYCDTDFADSDMPVSCKSLVAEGNVCISYIPCKKGLFCKTGEVDTDAPVDTAPVEEQLTGICTKLGVVDDACEANDECESFECIPGLCADGSGSCFTKDDCMGSCSITDENCNDNAPCATVCNGGRRANYTTDTDGNPYYEIVDLTGTICTSDDECSGTCSIDTEYTCTGDDSCTNYCTDTDGTTQLHNNTCDPADTDTEYGFNNCVYNVGAGSVCTVGTCDHMGSCEDQKCGKQSKCVGKPVCKDAYYPQNYCESAIDLIDSDYSVP